MYSQFLLLCSVLLISFTGKPQKNITFTPVKGYHFIGEDHNMSHLFLFIHNEKEWKDFFKPFPGHYVKKNITNIDWTKYTAIATIKSGHESWTLNTKKVELDEGELYFEYEAIRTDKDLSWKNATPLIILVPKGKYKAIKYIENGSVIRVLENFTGRRNY